MTDDRAIRQKEILLNGLVRELQTAASTTVDLINSAGEFEADYKKSHYSRRHKNAEEVVEESIEWIPLFIESIDKQLDYVRDCIYAARQTRRELREALNDK